MLALINLGIFTYWSVAVFHYERNCYIFPVRLSYTGRNVKFINISFKIYFPFFGNIFIQKSHVLAFHIFKDILFYLFRIINRYQRKITLLEAKVMKMTNISIKSLSYLDKAPECTILLISIEQMCNAALCCFINRFIVKILF